MKKLITKLALMILAIGNILGVYECSIESANSQSVSPSEDIYVQLFPGSASITEGEEINFSALFTVKNPNICKGEKYNAYFNYGEGKGDFFVMGVIPEEKFDLGNHSYIYAGIYEPSVIIQRICISSSIMVRAMGYIRVDENLPVVQITPDNPTYDEGSSVKLTAHFDGGNSPVYTVWDGPCTAVIGNGAQVITPSTPGNYTCTVTVTDVDGDRASDSVNITVNDVVEPPVVIEPPVDPGDEDDPVDLEKGGGNETTPVEEENDDNGDVKASTSTAEIDENDMDLDENNEVKTPVSDVLLCSAVVLGLIALISGIILFLKKRKEEEDEIELGA